MVKNSFSSRTFGEDFASAKRKGNAAFHSVNPPVSTSSQTAPIVETIN